MSLEDPNANTADPAVDSVAKEPSEVETLTTRAEAALAVVGVTPDTVNEFLAARMEAAAQAFLVAKIPADQTFWHGETVRLAAALKAAL